MRRSGVDWYESEPETAPGSNLIIDDLLRAADVPADAAGALRFEKADWKALQIAVLAHDVHGWSVGEDLHMFGEERVGPANGTDSTRAGRVLKLSICPCVELVREAERRQPRLPIVSPCATCHGTQISPTRPYRLGHSRNPRTPGHAGLRLGRAVRRVDESLERTGKAQPGQVSDRLHVSTHRWRSLDFEVAICDIKRGPRRATEAAQCFHGARRRDVGECASQWHGRPDEHPGRSRLRAASRVRLDARGACAASGRVGTQIRHSIQNRVSGHPRAHDSA